MGNGYYIYCGNCIKNINKIGNIKKYNSSIYEIITGGGFQCFHKDQLWDNYLNGDFPINDESIINEIVYNKNNGWEFDDPVGYLPFYCEKCFSLENKYYLQMVKNENRYIPEYKCKMCNTKLKSIVLVSEMNSGGSWAKYVKEIGKLVLIDNKNKVHLMDNETKNEYKIKCKKCKGNKFKIISSINWD